MPRGDFAKREVKKPKRDAKKATSLSPVVAPPPEPEVVRRPRKPREEEEE
jgi:hypothetical protein